MIDIDQARKFVAGGKDAEVVGVTRRWLKRAIFEIETGRRASPEGTLDYDPFAPPPPAR